MIEPTAVRQQLGSTIGALERIVAHLSRVEHGDGREIIGRARAELSEQANSLLVLRARLQAPETRQPAGADQ